MLGQNRVSGYPDSGPKTFRGAYRDDETKFDHRNWESKVKAVHPKQGTNEMKIVSSMSKYEERFAKLEHIYKEQGIGLEEANKRIDYVLVHDITPEKNSGHFEELRKMFIKGLEDEGMRVVTEKRDKQFGHHVFTKIHCPFKRLCIEAEKVKLEMTLKDEKCENEKSIWPWTRFIAKHFETDDTEDYESAPFAIEYINLFQKFEKPDEFFRPSIRSLLVNHMLINMDLKKLYPDYQFMPRDIDGCCGRKGNNEIEQTVLQKVGFPYMKMKGAYLESFVLHEASDKTSKEEFGEKSDSLEETTTEGDGKDARKCLDDTWPKFFKFQPLWKIRDYFGEKIALYFAWSGTLTTTLWIPMLLGIAIFIFGLVNSSKRNAVVDGLSTATITTLAPNTTTAAAGIMSSFKAKLTDVLTDIKEAFDNDATPFFAMIICIWGTIFLEVWKRHQARLAYEWDVEQFEETEPDRPEFYGTKPTPDPVSGEPSWYYPFSRQMSKFLVSFSTLLLMVCLVFISVVAVIVYRVIASVDYCPNIPPGECILITTIVSSVFNAVSVLILGKIYDWLARKLTEWENHRTQTQFDDALIIKLFVFQFANNYASCFYIAFFRGRFDDSGLMSLGIQYQDDCEGTCMSQLSFQVLILMVSKPLPKFFSDVILPWLKKLWKQKLTCCHCFCLKSKDNRSPHDVPFVEWEYMKPELGDFTLSEYTEKIIQYGFLMLFAASFPLAPLMALLTNLIDLRVDAKRMLWTYRRPLAIIREDIGMWYTILTLVNFAGVVSNSFLIAFTSEWGLQFNTIGKLWIVIGFEHIVFVLKFILAYIIPDVPTDVELAIRKKKFLFQEKIRKEEEERRKKHAEADRLYDTPWHAGMLPTTRMQQTERDNQIARKRLVPVGDVENQTSTDQVRRLRKKKKHSEKKKRMSHDSSTYDLPEYTYEDHQKNNALYLGRSVHQHHVDYHRGEAQVLRYPSDHDSQSNA
ncbi:hypothetical protein CHS0354_028912 [Potamilus streckersoni]|uniref:Anoctamin n=1 Tax=Potamilus streckersoni TaxID=2493646 RepID=A0AAE0SIX7_9BIVA|nr:hypothetical protein CHS0354_028912 [Potamilus streckersoni]